MKNPSHIFDIQKLINGEYSSKELRDRCEDLKMEREVAHAVGPFFNVSIIKALKHKHIYREDALALLANLVNMRIEEYMSMGDASETVEKLEHDIKLIRNELSEKDLIILARDEQITSLQNSLENLRKKTNGSDSQIEELQAKHDHEVKQLKNRYNGMCRQKKEIENKSTTQRAVIVKLESEIKDLKKQIEELTKKPRAVAKIKDIPKYKSPYSNTIITPAKAVIGNSKDEMHYYVNSLEKCHIKEAAAIVEEIQKTYVKPKQLYSSYVFVATYCYLSHFLNREDDVFKYKQMLDLIDDLKRSAGKTVQNLAICKRRSIIKDLNNLIAATLSNFEERYGITIHEVYTSNDDSLMYGDIPINKEFIIYVVGSVLKSIINQDSDEKTKFTRNQIYYISAYMIMSVCKTDTFELLDYDDMEKFVGKTIALPSGWETLYTQYRKGDASIEYLRYETKLSDQQLELLIHRTAYGIQQHKGKSKHSAKIKREALALFGVDK